MPTRAVVLPELRIGGYRVKSLPVWAYASRHGATTFPSTSAPIVIGNSAFVHSILTIDYKTHRLQICPTSAESPLSKPPGMSIEARFKWANPDPGMTDVGDPVVEGKLNGDDASFIIDTGSSGSEICVSPATLERAARSQGITVGESATQYSTFGSTSSRSAKGVHLLITDSRLPWYDISVVTPAISWPNTEKADTIIGSAVLEHFRITIDYPHRTIFFKPYR